MKPSSLVAAGIGQCFEGGLDGLALAILLIRGFCIRYAAPPTRGAKASRSPSPPHPKNTPFLANL